ncbi:MAG: DNA-formamidopyrimidine glycosylase [Bacilli bacterium]
MPELPEVETVKETLKKFIINKKIIETKIYYADIIENMSSNEFIAKIKNQTINDITRRGKWLLFVLDDYYLLSHLRMEGKYNIRKKGDYKEKHEHVIFTFEDETELRYKDTRKFGKMHLIEKEKINKVKPLSEIGLEPFDNKLNKFYLYDQFKNKKTAVKTALLDQTIIAGIGNIYADEILFLCLLNPNKRVCDLKEKDLENIIKFTKEVLSQAIIDGGTTIRSFTSSDGVHGRFQQNLLVHNKKGSNCPKCNSIIEKISVGTRGTYYCPKCQK